MKCPSCGMENNDQATFCSSCGARLDGSAQQAAPQQSFYQQTNYQQPNQQQTNYQQTNQQQTIPDYSQPAAPAPKKKSKKGCGIAAGIVAAIVVVVIIIAALGGGDDAGNTDPADDNGAGASQDQVVGDNSSDEGWKKDGTYKVGTDIPAGEYIVEAERSLCYIEVASDSSGEFDSIVANDNITTHTYVTVEDGQYFKIQGGKFRLESEVSPYTPKDGKYEAGEYKVGKDIPAGEYKVTSEEGKSAYIEVVSNSNGTFDSIVTNDNFTGDTYITVSDGQYLKVQNGYINAN